MLVKLNSGVSITEVPGHSPSPSPFFPQGTPTTIPGIYSTGQRRLLDATPMFALLRRHGAVSNDACVAHTISVAVPQPRRLQAHCRHTFISLRRRACELLGSVAAGISI